MKLSNHWSNVCDGHRHVPGTEMSKEKVDRIIFNFENYFINNLPKEDVKVVLDWGCGGGILTKEIKKIAKVIAFDICQPSLDSCISYAAPDYTGLVPDDLSKLTFNYPLPDLILAHAVVWHFPNINYFKEALNVWSNKIGSKYIALNTKTLSEENFIQTKNYKKEFLQALYLNDEFVIKLLHDVGYSLISSTVVTTGRQPQTYFVFVRNNDA